MNKVLRAVDPGNQFCMDFVLTSDEACIEVGKFVLFIREEVDGVSVEVVPVGQSTNENSTMDFIRVFEEDIPAYSKQGEE